MEAVAATAAPPDEAVPARTRTGDRKAFRALYEPHVEGMFDFALRVVRDRDLAADILKKTLARAWRLFRQQGGPGGARARLYGLAYDCVLDELRYQWRRPRPKQPARAGLDFTQIDPDRLPDASQVASDKELVELVWDTAAALNAEHYALLDLHVRHGLSPDELANHLAVESDRLQSRLSLLYESSRTRSPRRCLRLVAGTTATTSMRCCRSSTRSARRLRFKWRFESMPGSATGVRRASADSPRRRRSCEASRRCLPPVGYGARSGNTSTRGRASGAAGPGGAAPPAPDRLASVKPSGG